MELTVKIMHRPMTERDTATVMETTMATSIQTTNMGLMETIITTKVTMGHLEHINRTLIIERHTQTQTIVINITPTIKISMDPRTSTVTITTRDRMADTAAEVTGRITRARNTLDTEVAMAKDMGKGATAGQASPGAMETAKDMEETTEESTTIIDIMTRQITVKVLTTIIVAAMALSITITRANQPTVNTATSPTPAITKTTTTAMDQVVTITVGPVDIIVIMAQADIIVTMVQADITETEDQEATDMVATRMETIKDTVVLTKIRDITSWLMTM